jgi:hypothetical protein
VGIGLPSKRKREKERMDPRKSMRPELPVSGPGRGGRVGASATQHVVQNLVRDTMRDEDVSWIAFCYPWGELMVLSSLAKHYYECRRRWIMIHSGRRLGRRVNLSLCSEI